MYEATWHSMSCVCEDCLFVDQWASDPVRMGWEKIVTSFDLTAQPRFGSHTASNYVMDSINTDSDHYAQLVNQG